MTKVFAVRMTLCLPIVLAACGGGGGGDSRPRLMIETEAIEIRESIFSHSPPPFHLSGSVSGSPPQVFVRFEHSNRGIESVGGPFLQGSTAAFQIFPRNPSVLGHGVHHDTITISACADQQCTSHFSGSPRQIPVTYHIGIPATPHRIDIQAVEGDNPSPTPLSFDYFAGSANWSVAFPAGATPSWVSLAERNGTTLPAQIHIDPTPMAAGRYETFLEIKVSGPIPQTRSIPVTYTVLPVLSASNPAAFSVVDAEAESNRRHGIQIGSRVGERDFAWHAAVAEPTPWLRLETASGHTKDVDALYVSLDPIALLGMANGDYEATIRVSSEMVGASPIETTVKLKLDRPFIDTISPYLVPAGKTGTALLRGQHLLKAGPLRIDLGNGNIVTPTISTDTLARISHPALQSGRHRLQVLTDTGVAIGTTAELVVSTPKKISEFGRSPAPAYDQGAGVSLYDPERETCFYFSSVGLASIRRAEGFWDERTVPEAFIVLSAATLSNGGRTLILGASGQVIQVDPETLRIVRRDDIPVRTPGRTPLVRPNSLHTLDDGRIMVSTNDGAFLYQIQTGTFQTIPAYSSQQTYSSPAGNLIAWREHEFGYHRWNLFDPASLTSAPFTFRIELFRLQSDLFGDRWASITGPVMFFDQQGNTLGSIGEDDGWAVGGAISSDGMRMYVAKEQRLHAVLDPRIEIMDLSPLGRGSPPSLMGTVPLPLENYIGVLNADESEYVSCEARGMAAATIRLPAR